MAKLWDKGKNISKTIEQFTVGSDKDIDMYLAKYDIIGSLAHAQMLHKIHLLTANEFEDLKKELKSLYYSIERNDLSIEEGVEDIHSQIELMLTRKIGDVGKKIHSARSRNDQVLLDIKLYTRDQLKNIACLVKELFDTLIVLSNRNKEILMPGYTHLQVAMPSSFGLWFGAYAECLTDDIQLLLTAYCIADKNPLGSAAGYGSSFPIDRKLTTELLGFDDMAYNVVYAQMGRGKNERTVSYALASLGSTLAKLAGDICLFMSQNFGFVSLPDEYTTGSSIMPHKKNPDVFELIRAKCNKIQAHANEAGFISNNLPSGYFRDYQILKESYFSTFEDMTNCVKMMNFILPHLIINHNILENEMYKYIFSVEEVNKEVLNNTPFRDAYKKIGKMIEDGTFHPSKEVHHSHEGSIGNLCNDKIAAKFNITFKQFNFDRVQKAMDKLLK